MRKHEITKFSPTYFRRHYDRIGNFLRHYAVWSSRARRHLDQPAGHRLDDSMPTAHFMSWL